MAVFMKYVSPAWIFVSVLPLVLAGCRPALRFPAEPQAAGMAGVARAYDTGGRGRADFFFFADAAGRFNRIGYDLSGRGRAEEIVDLDAIPFHRCRHLVIILDGFGYDVVKAYYDAGGLRMFYPPSRVIAPYPTITDTSLEDIFDSIPCAGYEAKYFDRQANRMVGGAGSYLRGQDEPYSRLLQYRANLLWDAIAYARPWWVYKRELNEAIDDFDRSQTQEFIAYFVSSAGVSTQQGASGQKRCLARMERLIDQALWQTHGLVKITLLADHGHSYTPGAMAPLKSYLKSKGWRLRGRLSRDNDVVWVRFGLLTCASLDTRRPAALAADLAGCEGVDLVSFTTGDAVTVLSRDGGKAIIRRQGESYSYQVLAGDPLRLQATLARLCPDREGFYAVADLLAATADQEYPAPLERLWRAHFDLVQHPTSVLCSLRDSYFSGSKTFAALVKVASTHGSLNRANSTTFIMSTVGPLPALMRSNEIHAALSQLIGGPWPMRK
jgi:hypothetical protein